MVDTKSLILIAGSDAVLHCAAEGMTENSQLLWTSSQGHRAEHDYELLRFGSSAVIILKIHNVTVSDEGILTCFLNDNQSTETSSVQIQVYSKSIIISDSSFYEYIE